MSQNQNQGNVQGDEKSKEKSPMTWHRIVCDGFEKKKGSKVPVYNHLRLRRSGRICYFGPQLKQGAAWTVAGNPIDLCDENE
ncbi:hypothetical protein MtrunA17_Chr2g0282501 [Medicago truncatula]|uniref:Uncharacterized protein n=1 Tax=Medicago truncatula TaxID=3880 RepID=A0A396J5Q2_MEDTR|nr:hypothetical protein MtrunA17_Chr2g0282501 [Medicago truncatula]